MSIEREGGMAEISKKDQDKGDPNSTSLEHLQILARVSGLSLWELIINEEVDHGGMASIAKKTS